MPVIAIADCLITAELLTVSVNVLVEAVALGKKDAVTPFGRPVATKVTR